MCLESDITKRSKALNELAEIAYQAKKVRTNGLGEFGLQEYLKKLSRVLCRFEDGSEDVLQIVSRIRRDLMLGQRFINDTNIRTTRSKVPRFVIITAVWKRELLTKIFYSYYSKLKTKLAGVCKLDVLAVGSEKVVSRRTAEAYSLDYVDAPNSPLNEKWQAGVDVLREQNFDAVIIVGSDDFLSPSVFKRYAELYKQGANVVGFIDGHFFNTSTNEMLFWGGYGGPKRDLGMPERVGESIGMGRLLSREVLELLDYNVWTGEPINKGLDLRMRKNLEELGFLHVEYEEMNVGSFKLAIPNAIVTLKSGDEHMLLDVKYQKNITDFEKYRINSSKIYDFEAIQRKHFGAELVGQLRSLRESDNLSD